MAPERAEGKEADERADIYALGLILAEMATGRSSRFPTDLPPALDRVIRRCLETDPDERWQSARDLQWELESIAQAQSEALSGSRSKFPAWALAGIVTLAAIALVVFALLRFGQRPAPPPLARMNILLPEKSTALSLALSPDGRFVALVLVKDGKQQIWIRALDSADTRAPLGGTDNAADPFWSPDSHFVAFFADARLKKIDRSGGPVQTICDALGALGGTWNRQGVILIGGLSASAANRLRRRRGDCESSRPHGDRDLSLIPPGWPPLCCDAQHRKNCGWGAIESMEVQRSRRILPDVSNAPSCGSADPAAAWARSSSRVPER